MTEYIIAAGPSLTDAQVETAVELVKIGGAVKENNVRTGVKRKNAKIVFAMNEGQIIGVAALKDPEASYRKGLESEEKSNYKLPLESYPFELGYVAVSPDHQKNDIGMKLTQKACSLAEGKGMFATTSSTLMKEKVLDRLGFVSVGKPWKNDEGKELYLLVCSQNTAP